MNIPLVLLNMAALIFAGLVLLVLTRPYKLLFLGAMILPMVIWFVIALLKFPEESWGLTEVVMMFLRGIFILGVLAGALACYIVTKIKQR